MHGFSRSCNMAGGGTRQKLNTSALVLQVSHIQCQHRKLRKNVYLTVAKVYIWSSHSKVIYLATMSMKRRIVKTRKFCILEKSTSITHFIIVHLSDQLGLRTKGIHIQSKTFRTLFCIGDLIQEKLIVITCCLPYSLYLFTLLWQWHFCLIDEGDGLGKGGGLRWCFLVWLFCKV